MKTFILTFTLSILFCSTNKIMAQCGTSVSLKTQQEVDDFILTNPCNWLGTIFIISSSINNLQGLQHITEVTNDIYISSNSALVNLSGLENLTTLGGSLHINNNAALVDISALQNINYINGRLEIKGNGVLNDISGLQNVTTINDRVTITDNISLINLSLNSLTTANGYFIIGRNTLTDLSGLSSLSYVGGFLSFNEADLLVDFSGLANLTEVNGNLQIVDNSSLENFNGLNNLTEIGGYVEINNNPSLTDLTGLTSLSNVNSDFLIENNNSLNSLSGLENLDAINGIFRIKNNNSLQSITALQDLDIVGSFVVIENNPSLSSLAGLDNISNGPTEYIIRNNTVLSNCSTNSICNHLTSNGNHSISNNTSGCNNGGEIIVVCDGNLPPTYIDGNDIVNIVEGESITFTHSSLNYNSVVWTFSNAPSSALNSPTVVYANPGTYTVSLEATNANGSASDNIIVIVNSIENSPTCSEPTLTYPNPSTIINNTVENISDWILIESGSGTTKIESGDIVKLNAGKRITINSNFSVKAGARASFYIKNDIDDCIEDCSVDYFNNLYGNSGNEVIHSFTQTSDGGYIGAGFSRSGDSRFWVLKLSSTGEVEWENTYDHFETYEDAIAYSIKQTSDGGYIVIGYVEIYLLDYYTTPHDEIGLIKLDQYGNTTWFKQILDIDDNDITFFEDESSDKGRDIIQVEDGGYVMVSHVYGVGDDNKCQITKLDDFGEIIWYNEELENKIPQFIEQTANGDFVLGGYTGYVTSDIWLAKLDKNGNNILWSQVYTVSGANERAHSFVVDNDGGFTVCGYSNVNGNYDIRVLKIDGNGGIVSDKFYGGDKDEYAYSIYLTFDGGYIIGGYSDSSNNGDVSGINKGSYDAWVVKLDALGNIEWEKSFGSDQNDRTLQIEQTCEGGYIICGYTYGSNNGDITDTNNGSADAWIVKLDPFGNIYN